MCKLRFSSSYEESDNFDKSDKSDKSMDRNMELFASQNDKMELSS